MPDSPLDAARDPRLSRKITYDSGYKRLHSIAEELSERTGVGIAAGESIQDWRVRDIPLVASVDDLPLGTLLKAIADAVHCSWVRESAAGKITYRIYRGPTEKAAIDGYLARLREARLAELKWAWDAMPAFARQQAPSGTDRRFWLAAGLIAALGPEAKQQFFSGGTILIRGNDPVHRKLFAQFYRNIWTDVPQYVRLQPEPAEADIDSAALAVELRDPGYYRSMDIRLTVYPVIHAGSADCWTGVVKPESVKRYWDSSFPKFPGQTAEDARRQELSVPGMSRLRALTDWDKPYLKLQFDLAVPPDDTYPTFSTLIRHLHDSGGCNIVAEDFISHLHPSFGSMHPVFVRKTCVERALRSLSSIISGRGYTWFSDDNDRLIVGWASQELGLVWPQLHAGLLPESYLNSVYGKYHTSGIELDDFMHFTAITHNIGSGAFDSADSYTTWINQARDLGRLYDPCIPDGGFWRIYDALTPAQKLQAKSKNGFPLGNLDPGWVAGTLRQSRLGLTNDTMRYEDRLDITNLMMKAMIDPKIIPTMVMYIRQSPGYRLNDHLYPADYGVDMTSEEAAQALGLNEYRLAIRYRIGSSAEEAQAPRLWVDFPARATEREEQLLKAAEKTMRQGQ